VSHIQHSRSARRLTPALLVLAAVASGCRQDMHDQPRGDAMEQSSFFADGRVDRPQVEGTVARGKLRLDAHLYEGKVGGERATTFPFPVDEAVLERGRERYTIFCAPCHDETGAGRGMIVQRGMKQPTSFHAERLREASHGYFFDVITNGFGVMYDYSDKVPARDRWAIVAYVRALQLSRSASLEDLTTEERARLGAR